MADTQPTVAPVPAAPAAEGSDSGTESNLVRNSTPLPQNYDPALVEAAKLLEQPAEKPASEAPAAAAKAAETDTKGPIGEPAQEPAPAEPASRGWAAIKEQDKRLRDDRVRLEAERKAWEAEKQKAGTVSADIAARLKADPFRTLAELGMPFETIADIAIAQGDGKPAPAPQAPVKAPEIEQALKEAAEAKAEVKRIREEAFIADYRGKLTGVMNDPKYALLQSYPGAVDEAMRLAGRYAAQTGTVLTAEQVCSTMQETYREQLRSLRSHAAVRAEFGLTDSPAQAPAPAAPASPAAPQPKQPAARTITRDFAATTPPAPQDDRAPITEMDRLRQAAAALPPDADLWGLS